MAKEQERPDIAEERQKFEAWQATCDPAQVVCLDESSVKTNYTPMRGWSRKGKRCIGVAPGRWKTYTMLSYLKYNGEAQGMLFEGGVNKVIFKEFMEEMLLPSLSRGNVVVMDNLNVHKNSYDKSLFARKGIEIRHTPRYSPEYNPIEMMWSKTKADLRKAEPRDEIDIWRQMYLSHCDVTPQMAHNWYKESGYCQ